MVVTNKLIEVFPKLQEGGGFEFLKVAGSTRSRNIALLQCPSTGYTLAYLKDPSTMIGQATIYIRPLQQDLPLDCENSGPASGPVMSCITCQKEVPFSEMRIHRARCDGLAMQEADREREGGPAENRESAPVSDRIPVRPETSASSEERAVVLFMTDIEEVDHNDWKLIKEPAQAAKVFIENLLSEHASGKPLQLRMDLWNFEEDRERALLSFYKQQQEWACPLHCTLDGDTAIGQGVVRYFLTTVTSKLQFGFSLNLGGTGRTVLFEGEPDHLVPAASEVLIESNLFQVAGRMLGHTFLHHGPRVTGLSPAVIHTLFNGDPEMATIVPEDCPDLHIRSIIKMLEVEELSQEQQDTVSDLCMSWDLPAVTKTNKRWLHNKLLVHAVIGRIMRQIKQLRKGLKDVMVWPLLTSRPDVVPLLFPRMAEIMYTPQMLLGKITWPVEESDDEDDECDVETKCRIAGFLRMFIETASSDTLAQLLRFWVGWEMLPPELIVKISGAGLPTSVTCFETLKLPAHFKTYKDFEEALVSAINSSHTGFGLV
ncbi:G2/M phase-specific E3 ubiquitin-protein ligase-like [Paramormyrops kingsleyae]|uniref:G2/M phase-specific E3 ubiquitin-protein ligase-like n=1 Tax=Paramormyrops kingsleyae TaxID=1676925 RepID=UPI003B96FD50